VAGEVFLGTQEEGDDAEAAAFADVVIAVPGEPRVVGVAAEVAAVILGDAVPCPLRAGQHQQCHLAARHAGVELRREPLLPAAVTPV
jgi:hypothetical protein